MRFLRTMNESCIFQWVLCHIGFSYPLFLQTWCSVIFTDCPHIWRILAKYYGCIISSFETVTVFEGWCSQNDDRTAKGTVEVANNYNSWKMRATEDIYLKFCQYLSYHKSITSIKKCFTISIVFIVFIMFSVFFKRY